MLDAYGLRLMIEPAAARLASANADPAKGQELKRLLRETMKLVQLADMSRLRE
jgi:DNA-binding GntR family transcriptional regulator